ncbi:hypothetical protein [Saccharothrix australiensis]|uniref:Uncharacterized protein n=1 Tax=Saccharothrix australiensis TaxID=2072 RepID=A0A495W1Q0_9PSEU|nr:hypothetical protein [Saccharothrix australiensis]RKT53788.1 hypothetical protein C8E97_2369 [Saccharothrix australiensis]
MAPESPPPTDAPRPWVAGAPARELVVSLWYPAERRGGPRAAHTTARESELLLTEGGITGVPLDVWARHAPTPSATPGRRAGGARARLTGWKRRLLAEGAAHASSTDVGLLAGDSSASARARPPRASR